MKLLRTGVIGAGFIGQQHIEAIRRIPCTEVVAIADSDIRICKNKSIQLGIPAYYQDYKEMLQNPDIDVIHNCTPNFMHYAINMDIIRNAKHVYSEKPLAINTSESKALAELAAECGVANGVNFNYRQNSMVQEMRQRVLSEDIGRVMTIHGQYLQDWLFYDTDYDWRIDPQVGGPSRAVADIGSHCLDCAQFISGSRIKSVYANIHTIHPNRKQSGKSGGTYSSANEEAGIEVAITTEDTAFIIVRFENGAPGFFNISQVCAGKKNDLQINVNGSNYSMEWSQENADKLWIGHRNEPNELIYSCPQALSGDAKRYATLPNGHPVAWHDALRNGINEFYTSIRNNTYANVKQNYATFQDGHRMMHITEACLESNARNTWVDVQID